MQGFTITLVFRDRPIYQGVISLLLTPDTYLSLNNIAQRKLVKKNKSPFLAVPQGSSEAISLSTHKAWRKSCSQGGSGETGRRPGLFPPRIPSGLRPMTPVQLQHPSERLVKKTKALKEERWTLRHHLGYGGLEKSTRKSGSQGSFKFHFYPHKPGDPGQCT